MTVYKVCSYSDEQQAAIRSLDAEFSNHLAAVASAQVAFQAALDAKTTVAGLGEVSFTDTVNGLVSAFGDILAYGQGQGVDAAFNFDSEFQTQDLSESDTDEARLSANGIHVVNGIGLVEEGYNLVGIRDAYWTSGKSLGPWASAISAPEGSAFITVWARVPYTVQDRTDCGDLSEVTLTRVQFLGIDANLPRAAAAAGVKINDLVVSCYWVGSAKPTSHTTQKLRRLGLPWQQITELQQSAAEATETLPTVTILSANPAYATLRTSVIIPAGMYAALNGFLGQESTVKLMERPQPLGLRGVLRVSESEPGPIGGAAWLADMRFDRPGASIGGARLSDTPAFVRPTQTSTDPPELRPVTLVPLTNPAVVLLGAVSVEGTLEGSGVMGCAGVLDAALAPVMQTLSFVTDMLKTVVGAAEGAIKAVSAAVSGILTSAANAMTKALKALGWGTPAFAFALCLLGIENLTIPGLPKNLFDNLKSWIDAFIDLIRAPFDALLTLLGLASIPVCFGVSAIEALIPKCLPVKLQFDFGEWTDCVNQKLREVREALAKIVALLDEVAGDAKALVDLVYLVLRPISLSAGISACVSPTTVAVGVAASVAFR